MLNKGDRIDTHFGTFRVKDINFSEEKNTKQFYRIDVVDTNSGFSHQWTLKVNAG